MPAVGFFLCSLWLLEGASLAQMVKFHLNDTYVSIPRLLCTIGDLGGELVVSCLVTFSEGLTATSPSALLCIWPPPLPN